MLGLGIGLHKKTFVGGGTEGNAPVNVVAPIIVGTASIDSILTTSTGTWSSDTGVISFLYQWYADSTPIIGATAKNYTLTFEEAGCTITCRVSAIDLDGASAYVVSSNSVFFDYSQSLIDAFKTRVATDSGTFEAESCLLTYLNTIAQ